MLVSPHDEINDAVHIYAGYLASRNMALAVMLIAAAQPLRKARTKQPDVPRRSHSTAGRLH